MSFDIARFKSISGPGWPDVKDMSLTAFWGGTKHDASVQFTIGTQYTALSRKQCKELIKLLQQRIKHNLREHDDTPEYTP